MEGLKSFVLKYKLAISVCVLMCLISFGYWVLANPGTTSIGEDVTVGNNLTVTGTSTLSGDTRLGCRSGFWPISDGRICMEATLRGKNYMHDAIGACKGVAPGCRVCTHSDFLAACGVISNPYGTGDGSGWYGDHGLAVGGNWDDEFGVWNRDYCTSNNDGPAVAATSILHYYHCCY